ncbi:MULTISPECIES: DUF2630 family protein [Actinomadura]|uniref:DUF2630 family protein n=2 Tax=Actinomadura TaxID=1988 RepID=A0A2P4UKM2_9ACTN|nr:MULTISPECIES: DUF2630 family protein [Actinomadura]MXQ62429.1 DUF2630 family protein [Actinomadura rayongensis]POM25604.1 hypothetical protein BTM25_42520 [Actinomadura rubteroloni]
MDDDQEILARIGGYVAEEQELRARHQRGELSNTEEQARMRRLEEELDQCWDLLRQRRARRDAGQNPGEAHSRPAGEVEGYLQ